MRDFAFIGRSNVGKSSLINMLTNHAGLARCCPGKTQLINHLINKRWYLVDLMGVDMHVHRKANAKAARSSLICYKARKMHFLRSDRLSIGLSARY